MIIWIIGYSSKKDTSNSKPSSSPRAATARDEGNLASYKVPKIQKGQKQRYTERDLIAKGKDLKNYVEKEGLFSRKDPIRSRSPSVMILPQPGVSPNSNEEEVQVLQEITPRPGTSKDSSKKEKPIKEQILSLNKKEEKVILQAAKHIRRKKNEEKLEQLAERNKALAAALTKSYEREKKEKVHDTRRLNFKSTVKLQKIFTIFSGVGVNYKKKDLGLKLATNTEMPSPTISINNVILTTILPLKIAYIYSLAPSLLYLYHLIFQALNKGIQLRRLRNSYKSTPTVCGQKYPIKRASDSNNNVNVPATFSLYA